MDVTVERRTTDDTWEPTLATAFRTARGPAAHERTRPYRPRMDGQVERSHRTPLDAAAGQQADTTRAERLAVLLLDDEQHRWRAATGNQPPVSRPRPTT